MVRNYVRKSNRQSWTVQNMSDAIEACRRGEMGYKKAAVQYGVPRSTLRDRIKSRNKKLKGIEKGIEKGFSGYEQVFSKEKEDDLVRYILHMEEIMMGLTRDDVRSLAFQMAERNKLSHPFNKNTEMAGVDWYYSFMKRHPELSLRIPELTSAARARAFNRRNVMAFFKLFEVREIQIWTRANLQCRRDRNNDSPR